LKKGRAEARPKIYGLLLLVVGAVFVTVI